MIGDYGSLPAAKLQAFIAEAVRRPKASKRADEVDTVTVHTDGVTLVTEDDVQERRAGFRPMFRLIAGKKYRVTVEELD